VLTHITDKKQVQELLTGEESDLKAFFDEYFPRLYRFAHERLSGNHEATRDVVQNTLSKTLLNLGKYKAESTLFTWMCAICKNEIFDYLKKQSKYERSIVLAGDISEIELTGEVLDANAPDQPGDVYQRDQKTTLIHRVLDQMPANYGNVIEWKYIEGLSVAQIAQRLNLSHSAAQSILFRARIAFQEYYCELM